MFPAARHAAQPVCDRPASSLDRALRDSRTHADTSRPHVDNGKPLALRLPNGREVALDRRLVIGTGGDCDLRLDDPFVSARHCVVSWEERGGERALVLRDRASRNGCFVGGARISQVELAPGLRVMVGRTLLTVVAPGAVDEDGMLGGSEAMVRLRRQLERVAPSSANVLILGESGSGKELAARAVHAASGRQGAFVPINCGALAGELVESELFGHEKGAFTGALGRRAGVFEEARGGTLFLDEVGELPLGLQPKLLRALETRMVRAVGASGERRVDVRLVAATHQNLPDLVARGGFRLDLYHRLSTVELRLPTLRDRAEDIPLLARHFLAEAEAEAGPRRFSQRALDALAAHPWPGNVRELRNVIHRAALLGDFVLEPDDLFPSRPQPTTRLAAAEPAAVYGASPTDPPRAAAVRPVRIDELERDAIRRALDLSGGNRRSAARRLGMPKSTLCDRIVRYGIG